MQKKTNQTTTRETEIEIEQKQQKQQQHQVGITQHSQNNSSISELE
jgi:hypothetical protein